MVELKSCTHSLCDECVDKWVEIREADAECGLCKAPMNYTPDPYDQGGHDTDDNEDEDDGYEDEEHAEDPDWTSNGDDDEGDDDADEIVIVSDDDDDL